MCVPHVFVDQLIAINVSQIMLGSVQIQIEILKGWCTADIWKVKSNVSSVGPSSERDLEARFFSDKGPTLETLLTLLSISAVHQPFYIPMLISRVAIC